jgi:O-antigen ligase
MKMIRYNPVIGIGYGLYQQQAHIYAEARLAVRDVHQGLLLIGAEMGAPALLMFLFILLTFFRTGWYLYRRTHDPFTRAFGMSMMGMIIGVLVANCFGDRLNSLELSSYFWILGGVSMAVKRMFESGTGNFPEQEFSEETGTESEIHPAATLRDASRRELASAADIRRGIGK